MTVGCKLDWLIVDGRRHVERVLDVLGVVVYVIRK